jgi:23S rRNA (guanosine2251-2'-O)-methyltransferase
LEGEGLILGPRAVLEALRARGGLLRALYVLEGRRDPATEEIRARAKRLGTPPKALPRKAFDALEGLNHQGVAAIFRDLGEPTLHGLLEGIPQGAPSAILALDHIGDPGNLGALLRSAAAFGMDGVISPKDRAAGLAPAAVKAAQGAIEHVPFLRVANLNSALKELKKHGYWLTGAHKGAPQALPDFRFPTRTALVLGSESKGLSRLATEACDFLVGIPMGPNAESLNVSVAGAIFMYAMAQSRRK